MTNNEPIDKSLIALLMMVKNEEARICVSFDSVKDYTDTFIILDTGSTDKTISIIKEYCEKNNIKLFLKEEPFVNFEISRNVSLDFVDEVISKDSPKYILLLDCNDELHKPEGLYNFAKTYKGPCTGFHLKQRWWNGSNSDTYYNMRFVKSHQGWRYKGVVHEYMWNEKLNSNKPEEMIIRVPNTELFQDRTKDDDKSMKRFFRDKELLYNEYIKNPKHARTLFYLGQTCGCLSNVQEAYKYYYLRLFREDFQEEIYHSYFRMGEISLGIKHPWEESFMHYLKAFSHSQRAEPLIKIAQYYLSKNHLGIESPDYILSYMFIHMACKLVFPYNQILFIDRRAYDYTRWNILGIVAYYVGKYKEGKEACIKALEVEDQQIDMDNLLWYMRKERDLTKLINDNKKKDIEFIFNIGISLKNETIIPEEQVVNKITLNDLNSKIQQIILESKSIPFNNNPETDTYKFDSFSDDLTTYKMYINKIQNFKILHKDEQFVSFYRLGELSNKLGRSWDESINWYMKAFCSYNRVEPLLRIGEHYLKYTFDNKEKPDYFLAYLFIQFACQLFLPKDCTNYSKYDYNYKRWHLLGIVSFYVGRYKEGKEGCVKAILYNDLLVDYTNLLWYVKAEQDIIEKIKNKKIDQIEFKSLLFLSFNDNEIAPNLDETPLKTNKQDILTKATVLLLDEIKHNKN